MELRTCSKCGKELSLDNFYKTKVNGKIYYRKVCKICKDNIEKQYYYDNIEARKKYSKEYQQELYRNNPDYNKIRHQKRIIVSTICKSLLYIEL